MFFCWRNTCPLSVVYLFYVFFSETFNFCKKNLDIIERLNVYTSKRQRKHFTRTITMRYALSCWFIIRIFRNCYIGSVFKVTLSHIVNIHRIFRLNAVIRILSNFIIIFLIINRIVIIILFYYSCNVKKDIEKTREREL